jgi:hypothetical protein
MHGVFLFAAKKLNKSFRQLSQYRIINLSSVMSIINDIFYILNQTIGTGLLCSNKVFFQNVDFGSPPSLITIQSQHMQGTFGSSS